MHVRHLLATNIPVGMYLAWYRALCEHGSQFHHSPNHYDNRTDSLLSTCFAFKEKQGNKDIGAWGKRKITIFS